MYIRFALESVATQHPHHTLLVGSDFNLLNIIWGNNTLNFNFSGYTPPEIRESASSVYEIFSIFDAQQLYPPHPVKAYMLDHLFESSGCRLDLECFDPLITSDCHHVP